MKVFAIQNISSAPSQVRQRLNGLNLTMTNPAEFRNLAPLANDTISFTRKKQSRRKVAIDLPHFLNDKPDNVALSSYLPRFFPVRHGNASECKSFPVNVHTIAGSKGEPDRILNIYSLSPTRTTAGPNVELVEIPYKTLLPQRTLYEYQLYIGGNGLSFKDLSPTHVKDLSGMIVEDNVSITGLSANAVPINPTGPFIKHDFTLMASDGFEGSNIQIKYGGVVLGDASSLTGSRIANIVAGDGACLTNVSCGRNLQIGDNATLSQVLLNDWETGYRLEVKDFPSANVIVGDGLHLGENGIYAYDNIVISLGSVPEQEGLIFLEGPGRIVKSGEYRFYAPTLDLRSLELPEDGLEIRTHWAQIPISLPQEAATVERRLLKLCYSDGSPVRTLEGLLKSVAIKIGGEVCTDEHVLRRICGLAA